MKNIVYLAFAGLILFSCNKGTNSANEISGTIEGAAGETLVLQRFVKNKPVATDSVVLGSNGEFSISPSFSMPMDYYSLLLRESNTFLILLTDSTEQVRIEANAEDLQKAAKVDGSANTELLLEFYNTMEEYKAQIKEAENKYAGEKSPELMGDIKSLEREKRNYCTAFIRDKSPSPAIMAALSELNLETDLALFEKAHSELREGFGHSYYHDFMGRTIANEKAKQQIKKQSTPQASTGKNARYGVGSTPPDLKFKDPQGKERSLYDLRGKYVLIDFWASWCGPCRRENPNVVALYNKYKNKGFEIFSVSLDKQQDRWVQAIQQDQLSWPNHVSDLKGWSSEASQLYGVSSIPHTLLLDQEGRVIGAGLRGGALEAKLAEVLGS